MNFQAPSSTSPWAWVSLGCALSSAALVWMFLHELKPGRWWARTAVILLGVIATAASFLGSYDSSNRAAARTIDNSARAGITQILSAYPNIDFDVSAANDPEAAALMSQIEQAMVTAGWREHAFSGNPIILQRPGLPNAGVVVSRGIEIEIPLAHRYDWANAATALGKALNDAGLIGVGVHYDPNDSGSNLHLKVGTKP